MRFTSLCAALALLAMPTASLAAKPRHVRATFHATRHPVRSAASAAAPYGYGYGYSAGTAPVDPRYGYEEAPADANYHGPGAEVFAATKAAQRASGLLHELAPDAKVSATGIVVGGIN